MKVFKNKEGKVRSGWKILLSFLLMQVLTGILLIPAVLPGLIMQGTSEGPGFQLEIDMGKLMENPSIKLGVMIAQLIATLLTLLIFLKAEKRKWRELGITSIRTQGKNLGFGLAAGGGSILAITAILAATGQVQLTARMGGNGLWTEVLMGFIAYIIVAANEELYFRGYVVSTLSQSRSLPLIYIGSALIFCAAHLSNPNVHLLGIINIFLIGLLFSYMMIKTGTLWMPFGYHLMWNFTQGSVIGFPVSGLPPEGLFSVHAADSIWTGGSFGVEASIWTTVMIAAGFFLTKVFCGRNAHQPAMFASAGK
ncbi:CPBP family intramembrane metalloprotease [Metabacillus sp. GX 13764]|uniref:CPBP family intramembrane glutamic endopeptidase n=1 Tax=Metabacillus kandeliae TaxID=2900151 RepID=UPI001E3A849B|nr:CPBP family intramembrane glutamic endopeptidase [Metabacillus kandeliae]MCD7033471.1 CPBP family intramembrane metalloprotease [Metabacillus kandeliae]